MLFFVREKSYRYPRLSSILEQSNVAVDTLLTVNDAVVRRLVNHLAGGGVYSVLEAVAQLGKFVKGLLLVAAVIHIAHRRAFALILKNYAILHKKMINQLVRSNRNSQCP